MDSVGHPRGFGSDPPIGSGQIRGSPQKHRLNLLRAKLN